MDENLWRCGVREALSAALPATSRADALTQTEEMVGSYAASPEPYTKSFPEEDAPSGMMMRGDCASSPASAWLFLCRQSQDPSD